MITNIFQSLINKIFNMGKINFDQLRSELNNIPNINRGGCGVAALIMYDALVMNGKRPTIYYTHRDDLLYNKNLNSLKSNKYKNGKAPVHILLKLEGDYFDSTETFFYLKEHQRPLRVSKEFLLSTIIHANNWNKLFKRKDIHTMLKKQYKIDFYKYLREAKNNNCIKPKNIFLSMN